MIATDVVILVMFASTLLYIWARSRGRPRGRLVDAVVMRSIPGLIIFGTLFGALVVAMIGYGFGMVVLHPMVLTRMRIGPVHDWAIGIGSLGLGIVFGIVPVSLFAKVVDLMKEQRVVARAVAAAQPPPAVVVAPRVADLEAARRTALARITPAATIDQLAAAARDFLRDAYLTPPADVQAQWQPLLDRFDAARFGGAKSDATALGAELRALVG